MPGTLIAFSVALSPVAKHLAKRKGKLGTCHFYHHLKVFVVFLLLTWFTMYFYFLFFLFLWSFTMYFNLLSEVIKISIYLGVLTGVGSKLPTRIPGSLSA